ncbi:IS110 family transposase [Streptomyces chartreusis]
MCQLLCRGKVGRDRDGGLHVVDIGVVLGLYVGNGEHHATAVPPVGKKAFDKRLLNTEPSLRELFAKLEAKHGTVSVVVDQPASIGSSVLAFARDMGRPPTSLPGLTMRRIATSTWAMRRPMRETVRCWSGCWGPRLQPGRRRMVPILRP